MGKQFIRQRILRRLSTQSKDLRLKKSLAIERVLGRSSLYRNARVILCYVAVDGEVETRPILEKALADGKRVAVPALRCGSRRLIAAEVWNLDSDLKKTGPFGIPQPTLAHQRIIRPEDLDLLLVPGVAFDMKGGRLGRGGGYFDRFLSCVPAGIPRLGLAFRFQVVKDLPSEMYDQSVMRVLTD